MKTTLIVNQDGSLSIVIAAEAARQQQLLKEAGAEIKRGVSPQVVYDEKSGELRLEFAK